MDNALIILGVFFSILGVPVKSLEEWINELVSDLCFFVRGRTVRFLVPFERLYEINDCLWRHRLRGFYPNLLPLRSVLSGSMPIRIRTIQGTKTYPYQ